jgi:hypothetical protein
VRPPLEQPLARRWQRRSPARTRPLLRAALGCGLVALLAGVLASVPWQRPDDLSRRLAQGCEDVEQCQALAADAALQLGECWLGCEGERAHDRAARLLVLHAQERRRVRDHYRQSDALEDRIMQGERERRAEDEQRLLAARAALDERRYQRQLEEQRAEREAEQQRLAEQRAKELRYLGLLSPDGRELRLRRCHQGFGSCDGLLELLLDAAGNERERRQLADLNERLLMDKALGKKPAPTSAPPPADPPEGAIKLKHCDPAAASPDDSTACAGS